MRIDQIFQSHPEHANLIQTIARQCSTFLRESRGQPVLKGLPKSYSDIQKIKVRKHRHQTDFSQTFNEAFANQCSDLRERAVFTNNKKFTSESEDLFFVFPKNNYKFMYCTEVSRSSEDYRLMYDTLYEQFEHDKAEQLIRDLLKFNYLHDNLYEGLEKEVEIIFYNIPYYFAARANVFEYEELLTEIMKMIDN